LPLIPRQERGRRLAVIGDEIERRIDDVLNRIEVPEACGDPILILELNCGFPVVISEPLVRFIIRSFQTS
jgi:hypothetical protein